jgi:hypothetical protein
VAPTNNNVIVTISFVCHAKNGKFESSIRQHVTVFQDKMWKVVVSTLYCLRLILGASHPPCTQRDRRGRRRRLVDRNARAANGGGCGDRRRDSAAVSRRQAGADGSAKEVIALMFVAGDC